MKARMSPEMKLILLNKKDARNIVKSILDSKNYDNVKVKLECGKIIHLRQL